MAGLPVCCFQKLFEMADPASVGASVGLTKAKTVAAVPAVRPAVVSNPERVPTQSSEEHVAVRTAAARAAVQSTPVRPPECGRAVALFDFQKRNPDEIDLFAHETVRPLGIPSRARC